MYLYESILVLVYFQLKCENWNWMLANAFENILIIDERPS